MLALLVELLVELLVVLAEMLALLVEFCELITYMLANAAIALFKSFRAASRSACAFFT
jgi:hypothetical protein